MSGVNQAQFAYTQDSMGRTTNIAKTGTVFSRYGNGTEGLKSTYGYNDRSEVTSDVTRKGTTTTVLNGRDDAYTYDQLGNRKTATHNSNVATYTTNTLNQYTQRTVPGVFDVAGAAAIAATVTVNGSNTNVFRVGQYFFKGHALTNSPNAAYTTLAVSDGTTTTNLPAFVAATPEPFTYDFDGNLLSDGRWSYLYDAENRLIWTETAASAVAAGHPKVACHMFYDYLGRRVFKYHYIWSGGTWSYTGAQERFIYNGWNLIAELDGSLAITKNFFWGLDLSGTAQGAGGVGGLLFTQSAGNTLFPIYDALGNVHGMIKAADGSLAAAYEYDASGNTLRESGPLAASNPFRYSTKYTDLETSLVYYGYRYYHPSLGRFINKDPIQEMGGINLYSFCRNNGANRYDLLGQHEVIDNGDGTFTIVVNNYTDAGDNFSYYTGAGQNWVDQTLLSLLMVGGLGVESFDEIGGASGAAAIMGGAGGAGSPNPIFVQDLLMQSDLLSGRIYNAANYGEAGDMRLEDQKTPMVRMAPSDDFISPVGSGWLRTTVSRNAPNSAGGVSGQTVVDLASNTIGLGGELVTGTAQELQAAGKFAMNGNVYKAGYYGNKYVSSSSVTAAKASQATVARVGQNIARGTVVVGGTLAIKEVYDGGASNRSLARGYVAGAMTTIALVGGPIGASAALIYSVGDAFGGFNWIYDSYDDARRFGGPPRG